MIVLLGEFGFTAGMQPVDLGRILNAKVPTGTIKSLSYSTNRFFKIKEPCKCRPPDRSDGELTLYIDKGEKMKKGTG